MYLCGEKKKGVLNLRRGGRSRGMGWVPARGWRREQRDGLGLYSGRVGV